MSHFRYWLFLLAVLGGVFLVTGCATRTITQTNVAGLREKLMVLLPGQNPETVSARQYAESTLSDLIGQLKRERVGSKPLKKAAGIIEQHVVNQYLRRYDGLTSFDALFKERQYSQATAAALYAIVAEALGYTYAIRSDLWTVSFVLDPDDAYVPLRIPLPHNPRTVSDQAFQQNYLDLLRASGLLPEADRYAASTDLFQRYYYGETDRMTFRQLAGYLQYLEALGAYRINQFGAALTHIQQAQSLYNRPVHAVLRRAILLQLATQPAMTAREKLHHLLSLRDDDPQIDLQPNILKQYSQLADNYLFKQAREDSLDSFHRQLQYRMVAEPDLQRRLNEVYFLKKAAYHAQALRTDRVVQYVDSLHRYRPDDAATEKVLRDLLVWSLHRQRDWQQGLPTLTAYAERYPFLTQVAEFKDLDLFYRAEQIRHYYNEDQGDLGWQNLEAFQFQLVRYGPTPRNHYWILTAYLAASDYYFRRIDYVNARLMVERALSLLPTDPYLQHRLEVLWMYPVVPGG